MGHRVRYDAWPTNETRVVRFHPDPAMTREIPPSSHVHVVIQRYGLAILSVAIMVGVANLLYSLNVQGVEFPILLLAVAVTAWYAGRRPAILALLLASMGLNYY